MPGTRKRLRNRDPGSFERKGGFFATASRFRNLLKALVIMRTCCSPVYQALKDTLYDPAKVSTRSRVDFVRAYLGFFTTNTMTSEKVYSSRGYKCATAKSRLCFFAVSAQTSSRSEVGFRRPPELLFCDDAIFLLSFAPTGSRSPPFSPSQSAKSRGACDSDESGSR